MESLEFIDENGEKTQFYVIEETRINGINYLLVSESADDEEAEAQPCSSRVIPIVSGLCLRIRLINLLIP